MARVEAEHGFDDAADAYRRARPTYPEAAISALLGHLGLVDGDRVVDLGAETGIFSRQLAARGLMVTAVEPVAAMRAEMVDVGGITVQDGVAEHTGLPEECADAVFAATAWHWFDAPSALREVHRLLAPRGGGLGLVWNGYDETVPWVADYAAVADRRRPSATPSARSGQWREFFLDLPGWEPLVEGRIVNPWPTTPQGLVDRLLSSSAISRLPVTEREVARAEVEAVLRDHGLDGEVEITLPYETTIHSTKPQRG